MKKLLYLSDKLLKHTFMKLTEENYNKIKEKIAPYLTCSNCGNEKNMIVDRTEYHLTSKGKVGSEISYANNPSPFVPLSIITCPNCGYVKLFNLKILNIIETNY